MMRRSILTAGAAGVLVLGACSPPEVVVTAQIQQEDASQEGATQTLALGDMEVQLIPFDRDLVFDSLAETAETPEPPIPEDLLAAQEEIQEAQQRWQQLENRWNTLRDSLQVISEELEQYSRGESRYVALFNAFEDLESEYNRVDSQVDQAFEEFTELQEASVAQTQEVRIQRENWADEAFAEVGEIFAARIRASGNQIWADTTDAQGVARFQDARPEAGQWWVHARYELPFSELYWNVPVELAGGEVAEIRLTRENAEVRPSL